MRTIILCFVFGLVALPQLTLAAVSPERIQTALNIFFKNDPVMITIAQCESGFRHYHDDGSVLRGGMDGKMIGLYQIHEDYHRTQAGRIGLNIDSLVGNILYAKVLYTFQGTTPWASCL